MMTNVLLLCWLVGIVLIFIHFTRRILIPWVLGAPCPQCGERRLIRVACISFGDRFYRCANCGLHCKRSDSSEPWFYATDPDDERMYKTKPRSSWFSISSSLPTHRDRMYAALCLAGIIGPILIGAIVYCFNERWGIPLVFLLVSVTQSWLDRKRRARPVTPIESALWDSELDR